MFTSRQEEPVSLKMLIISSSGQKWVERKEQSFTGLCETESSSLKRQWDSSFAVKNQEHFAVKTTARTC